MDRPSNNDSSPDSDGEPPHPSAASNRPRNLPPYASASDLARIAQRETLAETSATNATNLAAEWAPTRADRSVTSAYAVLAAGLLAYATLRSDQFAPTISALYQIVSTYVR